MSESTNETALLPANSTYFLQRRLTRLILLIIIPIGVLLLAGFIYLQGGQYVETDNAYLKADTVPVSTDAFGTIKEVLVKENEAVLAGQLLFRVNASTYQVEVDKAKAKLAKVVTDLMTLKASYNEKLAEITVAKTHYSFAKKEQQRQVDLLTKNYISASRFDDAKQRTDLAEEQIITLQQSLNRIAESLGGSVHLAINTHPSYLAELSALEQAKLHLSWTEVRASLPGIVSNVPHVGQYVKAGSIVLFLVIKDSLRVEANFTETDLTHVRPGQSVSIHIDAFPEAELTGVVESLSPATGAEFSIIPAQNATGNWVKIAQRVPVRIKIKNSAILPQLIVGLSTVVEIDTKHHRQLWGYSP